MFKKELDKIEDIEVADIEQLNNEKVQSESFLPAS